MKAKKQYAFEPDYAVAPGETLQEVMASLEMNQKELAKRLELTEQTLIRIFKGEQPISYATANRLELVTRVPARFWNNLEAEYREQLAKQEERQRLAADIAWLKTIPVRELTERGCLEPQPEQVPCCVKSCSSTASAASRPGGKSGRSRPWRRGAPPASSPVPAMLRPGSARANSRPMRSSVSLTTRPGSGKP